jgi:hypothetical protein
MANKTYEIATHATKNGNVAIVNPLYVAGQEGQKPWAYIKAEDAGFTAKEGATPNPRNGSIEGTAKISGDVSVITYDSDNKQVVSKMKAADISAAHTAENIQAINEAKQAQAQAKAAQREQAKIDKAEGFKAAEDYKFVKSETAFPVDGKLGKSNNGYYRVNVVLPSERADGTPNTFRRGSLYLSEKQMTTIGGVTEKDGQTWVRFGAGKGETAEERNYAVKVDLGSGVSAKFGALDIAKTTRDARGADHTIDKVAKRCEKYGVDTKALDTEIAERVTGKTKTAEKNLDGMDVPSTSEGQSFEDVPTVD